MKKKKKKKRKERAESQDHPRRIRTNLPFPPLPPFPQTIPQKIFLGRNFSYSHHIFSSSFLLPSYTNISFNPFPLLLSSPFSLPPVLLSPFEIHLIPQKKKMYIVICIVRLYIYMYNMRARAYIHGRVYAVCL